MTTTQAEYTIRLRRPHARQQGFVESKAKRKVIRAGRRSGKTVGIAILAVKEFLAGRRVLYAAPTQEQIDRFWEESKRALSDPIEAGVFYKNETRHIIEVLGTEQRIRAKTAWNADTLRGDYADLLILDEWQLMDEDAWEFVGAPMLLDHNGDAVFIYTPPSLRSRSVTKARNPRHAARLFKRAQSDTSGRWETFFFTSHENPYISVEALDELTEDMTSLAIRQEIYAQDVEEMPGALWKLAGFDEHRVEQSPDLKRMVVAIDPAVTSTEQSDEVGLVLAGVGNCDCKGREELHGFLMKDKSGIYTPNGWARTAVEMYAEAKADRIIGEVNNGGEMIENTIRMVEDDQGVKIGKNVSYKAIHASRGKAARAEPVAALYEQGRIHHVGSFPELEEQLTTWEPLGNSKSPDRLDADVWAFTELMLGRGSRPSETHNPLGVGVRNPADNPLGLNLDDPRYQDTDRR